MHYNIWGDQCSQYRDPRGFSACTMPYGKTNIQGPQGFLLFYWGHMEDHIWYLLLLLDQLTRTLAQGVLLLYSAYTDRDPIFTVSPLLEI